MIRFAITLATLTLLLAACAGETPGGTVPGTSPDSTLPTNGGTIGDVDQQMLDDLLDQAAQETGVGLDEISVVTAEAVTWSDGSIGCPEEGMGYTQALVPGYRVILDVAGEQIHYHAGSDGQFRACDNPQEPIDDGTVDQ
jgi:hypothetical protein